jgi:hypothetical protein
VFQPATRFICHNGCVRRVLAISLLALFGLPIALPLLGAKATDAKLPICCRKDGKHHCAMSMDASNNSSARTIAEKCPYSIPTSAIPVLRSATPAAAASIFAGIIQHPAAFSQVEAHRRISFDRSRQKRGPPSQLA